MAEVEHPAFDNFVRTVAALRAPETGCPWNRAQTHESLSRYMIEEAYETADAVDSGNPDRIREELGDVLLQVVLNSQVAADAGTFTIDDVCATIDEKMIRRHPHVFGDVNVESANEVDNLWEQVKLAERAAHASEFADGESPRKGLLEDVPAHFPALLQAQKISRKAVAVGFEWDTLADVWDKVAEERAELEEAYASAPKDEEGRMNPDDSDPRVHAAELEFGDLLFALVNVGRKMGIDAEAALRASNAKFRRRFAEVERQAWEQGSTLDELSLEQMEAFWQHAKEEE